MEDFFPNCNISNTGCKECEHRNCSLWQLHNKTYSWLRLGNKNVIQPTAICKKEKYKIDEPAIIVYLN